MALHITMVLFAHEWRFCHAVQLPCEIHVHMIDGAREPETWLDRRPRGNHIAG